MCHFFRFAPLESTMATTGAMCATSGILEQMVHRPHIQPILWHCESCYEDATATP